MGAAAAAVPYIVAAVGAGASYVNTRNTNKRKDNALATQLRNTQGQQRKADAEIHKLIADTEASNPGEESAKALSQYTDALRRNSANNTSSIQSTGGTSSAFKDAAADATAGIATEGKDLSGIMSRIDGAIRQRQNEANSRMDTQSIINLLGRDMGAQNFIDGLRIDGITENPWLSAVSQAASSYSTAAGGGGGISGAASTTPKKYKKLVYKGNSR